MSDPSSSESTGDRATRIQVRSLFVRERNALAVVASFEQIYVDYYLHLLDHGLRNEPEADHMLKEALATVVLHATTRPWKETHAWTLNIQEPLLNIFVTASSLQETVTGRVFTDGVRSGGEGVFNAQVTAHGEEPRRSSIPYRGGGIFQAVGNFYEMSEQRMCRIFTLSEEEILMVSAQPDCDLEWLSALTPEAAAHIHEEETLSLLESRYFRFECGCTLERVFPAIAPLARRGMDDLFQGEETITINCPRCAARWRVTREQMEAIMTESASDQTD